MRKCSRTQLVSCAIALTVLLCVSAAIADPTMTTVDETNRPPTEGALEVITVTARRIAENLQTTGASVTVFTAEDLTDLNIVTAANLTKYTPNLELKANAGSAAEGLVVKIRGIGVSNVDFLNADPSVATYIDGVFQARAFGPQFELYDVDNIEVLRGPQGTLYGKNALGGAINIVTHKPDGHNAAVLDVSAENYGTLDITGRAQTSLIKDTLFASLSVISRDHDAYYHNLVNPGEDPGNQNLQSARLALRALPSSTVSVDVVGDYTRQRQNAGAIIAAFVSPTGLAATGIRAAGFNPATYAVGPSPSWNAISNVYLDGGANAGSFLPPGYGGRGRSIDNATFQGVAGTISADLSPEIFLRSISGYRTFARFLVWDVDGTPAPLIDEIKSDHGSQFTEELQLTAQLFDQRLELITGGFFFDEKLYEDESNGFLTGLADSTPSLQVLSSRNVHNFTNRSEAAFAHAVWHLAPTMRITAGIRYSEEHKVAHYQVGPSVTPNNFSTLDEKLPLDFSATTPMLGIEYEITSNIFGYASASKGYASGGYNDTPSALTGKIATFNPEKLWNYEIGLKTELLDHRLRVNVAGFIMNYDDIVIQTFGVSPTNGGVGIETTNAGRARVTGGEAALEWLVMPGLKLRASLGELDQKFLDFGIGANGLPVPASTAHFFDSPSTTSSVVGEYTLPLAPNVGAFKLSVDWSHRDRTWFDNTNTVVSFQKAYSLFGTRLEYASPNSRLALMSFVDNIANQVYAVRSINGLATPFGLADAIYGQPRTFGLRVTYKM